VAVCESSSTQISFRMTGVEKSVCVCVGFTVICVSFLVIGGPVSLCVQVEELCGCLTASMITILWWAMQ